jgi:hypothetical protein
VSITWLEPKEYYTPLKVKAGSKIVGIRFFCEELQEYFHPEIYGGVEIVGEETENPTTFRHITFVGQDMGSLRNSRNLSIEECRFLIYLA